MSYRQMYQIKAMSDGVKLGHCPILTIDMYLKKIEVH